jgi:hypothetical protein
MERVVTVNASRANTDASGEFGAGYVRDAGDGFADDFGIETAGSLANAADGGSQGPCLYFGSRGERCDRPALRGGFCSRHQPGGLLRSAKRPTKLVAAVLAALGVLWPLLGDIVKAVFRWIHSH